LDDGLANQTGKRDGRQLDWAGNPDEWAAARAEAASLLTAHGGSLSDAARAFLGSLAAEAESAARNAGQLGMHGVGRNSGFCPVSMGRNLRTLRKTGRPVGRADR
jgi:hypothetical protein